METNINQELADKIAIRELVSNISIFGDRKDFQNQVKLFSENAISETINDGVIILKLEGRNAMVQAFDNFLKNYEIVYHFNGQQTITLNGDNATGTCYCLITLVGKENGKRTKTSIGAIYNDEYIRVNNQWLVEKRIGNFEWQEKNEIIS